MKLLCVFPRARSQKKTFGSPGLRLHGPQLNGHQGQVVERAAAELQHRLDKAPTCLRRRPSEKAKNRCASPFSSVRSTCMHLFGRCPTNQVDAGEPDQRGTECDLPKQGGCQRVGQAPFSLNEINHKPATNGFVGFLPPSMRFHRTQAFWPISCTMFRWLDSCIKPAWPGQQLSHIVPTSAKLPIKLQPETAMLVPSIR